MSSEIADKYIAAYALRARADDRAGAEFKLLNTECKILAKQWFDAVAIETIRAHGLPSAGFVPDASVAEKLGFEITPRPTGLVKPTIDLPADADMTKIEGVIIERAKTGIVYASLLHLFLQAKFYQVLVKTLPSSVQRGDFNRWIKNKSARSLILDGVLGVRAAAPKPKTARSAAKAAGVASSRTASPVRSEPRTPRTQRSPRTVPSAPTKTPKSPRAQNAKKVARELFKSPASTASGGRGARGARGARGGRGRGAASGGRGASAASASGAKSPKQFKSPRSSR